jgi:hypothetical protein
MAIAQSVEETIVSQVTEWEGAETAEKRGGRMEFRFGGRSFGHVDDDGSLDLPVSTALREALVATGRTHPHPTYTRTGWTTFDIGSEADIEAAVRLLRLSYVHRVLDASHDDGRASLADGIDIETELTAFDADEGVRDVLLVMAE